MQLVNGLKKCMDYLIYYKQDLVIRRGYKIWSSDDVTVKYQFPWEVQSSWFRPVNEPLHRTIHGYCAIRPKRGSVYLSVATSGMVREIL